MPVAGLGNGSPSPRLAARVLAWHKPEERHEGTGRGEAPEVVKLGDEADGSHRVDAAEAAEPRDRFGVRDDRGEGGEVFFQVPVSFFELVDRSEVTVEGRLAGRIVESKRPEPHAVTRPPSSLRRAVITVTPQQELAHAVPRSGEILADVFPTPAEIAKRLLAFRGRMHLGQQIRPQQLGELARIASVGLDPRSGLDRGKRRSDHPARHSGRPQLPLQRAAPPTSAAEVC